MYNKTECAVRRHAMLPINRKGNRQSRPSVRVGFHRWKCTTTWHVIEEQGITCSVLDSAGIYAALFICRLVVQTWLMLSCETDKSPAAQGGGEGPRHPRYWCVDREAGANISRAVLVPEHKPKRMTKADDNWGGGGDDTILMHEKGASVLVKHIQCSG